MSEIILQPKLRWPREPYPGLRPFRITADSDESLVFCGRNNHKDEILKRLELQQMVFVTGPSGCGKSSLVRAGVLPVLQAGLLTRAGSDWRIVTMRPGLSPILSLSSALSQLSSKSSQQFHALLSRDLSALWMAADIIREMSGVTNPILVLIDQFEEVFRAQVSADEVNQLIS
jgi:energy-coupling factor transporter ATP-binding protein EcfA2